VLAMVASNWTSPSTTIYGTGRRTSFGSGSTVAYCQAQIHHEEIQ
jgi:hypothetical protein